MTTINGTHVNIDLSQSQDAVGRTFGYVCGDGGGLFFTWMDSIEETIESIEEDSQDGDGGLDATEVANFLRGYLPTTSRGRNAWSVV